MNYEIDALAVIGTTLYAGGDFTEAGGVSANHVAKWDGNSWSPLGDGVDGNVLAMVAVGTDLYVGGGFATVGTTPANNIAKWDGTSWSALGDGVDSYVSDLAVSGTDLYVVGGAFGRAGGKRSSSFAIWHAVCGNGLKDIGEACDDGNAVGNDGCENDCTLSCGNGIVTAPEACDDGNTNDNDGCKNDCTLNICGDGSRNIGVEACDDGNAVNGDGCDNNCTVTACGNGIVSSGEGCDDGGHISGDGCDATCHVETCWTCNGQPSSCTPNTGSSCDDGLFCNGIDTCAAGVCQHAGDPCAGGSECSNVCDEPNATCNLPMNTACSSDGIPCTDDVCDGNGTCAHPSNTAPCDDGSACTLGDVCSGGACIPGGGAPNCDDSNPCTDDSCSPATGCVNAFNTAPCDDGSACTLDDVCSGGTCVPGGAPDCNDNNPCTDDSCSPATGCVNAFNSNPCDDGNFCTVNDTCNSGVCNGSVRDCSDSDACTVDSCNETSDSCDHAPQLTCGDTLKCGSEQCDDGNTTDGDGCQADCTFTPVTVSQDVGDGGIVNTPPPSAAFPTQTEVTTPNGGHVDIVQTSVTAPPVSGFGILGQQIVITAPPASPAVPLHLVFTTDASVIPPGLQVGDLQISKDGVLLPDCTGPANQASPDPCISSRQLLPNGDAQIVALTSTASTWATVAPAHDSVILPRGPLAITIPAGATSVTKKLKIAVLNADILPVREPTGHTIQLTAASNCPAGVTVGAPDFSPPTATSSVTLTGGKSKAAVVTLSIDATGIANLTTVNKKAPTRCTLTFTATTTVPTANQDPVPSNDTLVVDVDFIDKHDTPQATAHESVSGARKRVVAKIAAGATSGTTKPSVKIVNADILPQPERPGHTITVTAGDGSCPAGTVGAIDYDLHTAGTQNFALVKGGMAKAAPLPLTVRADKFHSGNAKSPARCVATVSVSSPSGDVDASNNTAHLVVDVIDKNDF